MEGEDNPVEVSLETQEKIQQEIATSTIRHAGRVRASRDASPEGLEEEIAKLRKLLRESVKEEDVQLMLMVIDAVRKTVVSHYRISKKAEDDLTASIANAFQRIGMQLYPEWFRD